MVRHICWLALVVLLAGGCSARTHKEGTVKVHGEVTDAGQPLHVERRDVGVGRVNIGFYRIYDDGQPLVEVTSADAAEDGSFEVIDGIEPGKYLIAVRQWDPFPSLDQLGGRFDEENSTIVRVLEGDEQELIIDLSKPEG